jgi:glycosyltransferase involved in cell wall biosynthesis
LLEVDQLATVSVVLTSYNHASYLKYAIESVINQTYSDWELFIWDDVSSDNSWEIIQSYSDRRITAIRNSETKRYIFAINETVTSFASGKYLAVHHSDDAWEPGKLAAQVDYLDQHPDVSAVFTHARLIDEFNCDLKSDAFILGEQTRADWLRRLFLNTNRLCHPSVLIRKNVFSKIGLYKLVHAQTDDAELWTRLLLVGDIHVIPEMLTLHRKFSDGSNVSGDNPRARARLQFEWFEQKKLFLRLSTAEILEIFPESKLWLGDDGDGDKEFLLAMVAINLGNASGTKLFGLDLLYHLLNDPEHAKTIKTKHGFDYLDFIDISGRSELLANNVEKKVATNLLSIQLSRAKRYFSAMVRRARS